MTWVPKQFRLAGGVNEEDPQFVLQPGQLAFSRNYECLRGGGYKRVAGYERYDTKTSPASATYKWYSFISGVLLPSDQVYVNGATSGAHGYVCGLTEVTSGSWAGSNAVGKVALTAITGVFQSGELLRRNSDNATLCTLSSALNAQSTDDDSYESWIHGARKHYRDLITVVPGTGSILGVFVLGGYVYAWRATQADATKQALYKATGGGWSLQTLTGYIKYTGGVAEVAEGVTITGASSGATAIVRRVNIASGSWTGPTYASGRFAITNITGNFTNGENLQVAAVTVAVANGTQVAATAMTATGARHQIVISNFYGASDLTRAYGVDGVNPGWEFDGTYFCAFNTGMTTDTPKFVAVHRNHLFVTYDGGSIQNSGTGLPLTWSPRTGASEIGIGDDPTGIISNGNNTLAITAKNSVHVLTGINNSDWNLRMIADDVGTVAYSIAGVGGQLMFLDRAGVNVLLPAPPTFQDYSTQSISRSIRPTIESSATLAVDSINARLKSQYRVFFSDKTGIIGSFDGTKLTGWTQVLYAHQITCSASGDDTVGAERMFAGISTGYVVELDVGSSFDGEVIESILQLPFGYHGIPDRDKRYHKLTLEMTTPRAFDLYYAVDFDYGASQQPGRFLFESDSTSALSSFALFGTLFWTSSVLSATEVNIDGIGRSIGIAIYNSSAVVDPFVCSAVLLQFTPLGVKR
ncbi:MAG: hypothetical protein RL409_928 [Gemmatimonadota bacterium]